ncbi:hypothetical protein ACOZ38_39195 [Sphaerisporangium viridialbum]|uniref:hypothetical protein n=1 Tax=Sphaerisporangium viridialbum TaxID=46189 RepID=UPI003C7168BF
MDSEIQLISDGDGLVVTGDPTAVKEFLVSEGLWSSSKDLGQRLKSVLGTGAVVAQAGSEVAANSGRWLKTTKESAHLINKCGLRKAMKTGNPTGVVLGKKGGQIGTFVEFVKGPSSLLNPAMLSGVAGIMAQAALQQSMAEITAYLARIDEKVDDVLRKVDGTVLKDMRGARTLIGRATTMREYEGRVTDDSWSTVQDALGKIAGVQEYALLQLEAIAEKMEGKTKIRGLAKAAEEAEREVKKWLAVLAECFQLQDAFDELNLDRALDKSPEELDARRWGLKADRQNRLEVISQSTESLLARMDVAVGTANAKVLLQPAPSRAVVDSSNQVATGVHDFRGLLGIESGRQSFEKRRWMDAAAEARDKALEKAGPAAAAIAVVSVAITLKVFQDRGEES